MNDIEKRLFDKLESIQKSCGQVCDTRISGKPGKVNYKKDTLPHPTIAESNLKRSQKAWLC